MSEVRRTGPKAVTRRLWGSRCIGLVAVPVSIGLATLVLAVGTLSLCTRQLTRRRSSAPVVDLPDHQGDLQCRARVGGFPAPFISVRLQWASIS